MWWTLALGAGRAFASPLFDHDIDHDIDHDAPVEVVISGPFRSLFASKQQQEYLPFSLDAGGSPQAVDIRLRGHSRLRECEFPPLRLRFPTGGDGSGVFAGQRRLKLVTHCHNYDRGEQDLLEEYAVYRILNVLTDLSYRVRLLHIRYQDTDRALPPDSSMRYGFVLEPEEEFSARTGAVPVVRAGFPRERHDREQAALMYVFQYLVANTDWSLVKAEYAEACCHNTDLFELDSRLIFVPYDFDLTGLVNARYAFPDRKLRIDRVTKRLYRGLCTDRDRLHRALATVTSKRAEILAVVRAVPGLGPRNAERDARYLDDFFAAAADEEGLLKSFERGCL